VRGDCNCLLVSFLFFLSFFPILLVSIYIAASNLKFILSVVYADGRPSLSLVAHYDNDTAAEHAINICQSTGSRTQPPI
jgi:hypothetical protein